jgi:hypothetical protein
MRAWPQVALSRAMVRMSWRRSFGILGLPMGRDLHRQNKLNPRRCQSIKAAGRTATKASFQLNRLAAKTIASRMASGGPPRLNLTFLVEG